VTQNTDKPGLVDNGALPDPDELLTVRQVADLLGLNDRYVRNELVMPATPESILAGKHIESIKLGKGGPKARYRIKRRWVDEFLERRRLAKGAAPARASAAIPV
jgi:hypothetical protein